MVFLIRNGIRPKGALVARLLGKDRGSVSALHTSLLMVRRVAHRHDRWDNRHGQASIRWTGMRADPQGKTGIKLDEDLDDHRALPRSGTFSEEPTSIYICRKPSKA